MSNVQTLEIVYLPEVLHSSKKNQDFYILRLALRDKITNSILVKSQPILWLTKEQYDNYTSQI